MPAIPAIITGGVSLATGLLGSHAAKSAAQTQADAATQAAAQARAAGEKAATDITQAGTTAATGVTQAGQTAATGVTMTAEQQAEALRQAAAAAQSGVASSTTAANDILSKFYGDNINLLNPYTTVGSTAAEALQAGIAPGGRFDKTFTPADLELDPGYQFRLQEGQKALERSAAAAGTLGSGGTLKALASYSQGLASDEYQKAFERYRVNQGDAFTRLNTLAQTGLGATTTGLNLGTQLTRDAAGNLVRAGEVSSQYGYQGERDASNALIDAATRSGGFLTDAASRAGQFTLGSVGSAGNYRTNAEQQAIAAQIGAANAQAAGKVASTNAWTNMLPGIGGALGDIGKLIFKPQAKPPTTYIDPDRYAGQTG